MKLVCRDSVLYVYGDEEPPRFYGALRSLLTEEIHMKVQPQDGAVEDRVVYPTAILVEVPGLSRPVPFALEED